MMGFYETADYHVIEKDGSIELRQYDTFYVASTKTRIDNRQSSGFNNVFNYISGQNNRKEKISMTVPVLTTVEEDYLITSFVVPSKYHGDIPQPLSTNVFIEEISEGLFIAIRFSGSWTKENYDKYDQQLMNYIQEKGYQIDSKRYVFRYQGPFIPSFFRRNEIVYRIKR
jgi:effector-binding domain-containing protein